MSNRLFLRLSCVVAFLLGPFTVLAEEAAETPPSDPFDYSYCGGKPMYPVVGFNFSTFCGPRNQIALGRRGRIMWLFPTPDGRVHARGERQLSVKELAELKLLAQAAQLAGAPTSTGGQVLYDMGINFSGQANMRAHGALGNSTDADSVQALFDGMQELVPDKPLLPGCTNTAKDFSPTLLPKNRQTKAGL